MIKNPVSISNDWINHHSYAINHPGSMRIGYPDYNNGEICDDLRIRIHMVGLVDGNALINAIDLFGDFTPREWVEYVIHYRDAIVKNYKE